MYDVYATQFQLAIFALCKSRIDATRIESISLPLSEAMKARTCVKDVWMWEEPMEDMDIQNISKLEC